MNAHKLVLAAVLISFALATDSISQDAASSDQQQKKELLKSFYRDFASRIEFKLADGQPLELIKEPVMSWAGQEVGDFTSGDVFVWTRKGRAEMIGCIGSLPGGGERRSVFQEYHSLATQPFLETILEVEGPWGPKSPGVDMKTVTSRTRPTANAKLRLAQMRRVAESFSAFMHHPQKEKEDRLRVMTQPIFRFDTKKLKAINSKVVDGAIFAYVWDIGTDPELLLLLECHKENDQLVWKYAPIRFTYRIVRLEHNDAEVWEVERDGGNRTSAYRTTSGGVHSYSAIETAVAKTTAANKK